MLKESPGEPSGRLPLSQQPDAARILVRRGCYPPSGNVSWRIGEGWAGQQSLGPAGRRHLFSFLLPGDLLPGPSSHYEIVALTDLHLVQAPLASQEEARAAMEAAQGRLFAHARRLAACSAYERIAGLLLELHQRSIEAGLARGCRFPFLVGQSHIGAMMGLSEVHVNRTFAKLRADGHLLTGPGWLALPDRDGLRRRLATQADEL